MKTKSVPANPHKTIAAQQAQTGLISVNDLSLLTGVEVAKFNSLAKKGILKSYDEYHGKRFYNFGEILNWVFESEGEDEIKLSIRLALENEMKSDDCPYALQTTTSDLDQTSTLQIIWKELIAA
jgi:hypothetical protein